MSINKKDIEQYLSEVKDAVGNDRYRLDRNSKRKDNINLFLDYVIDEAKAKDIILSLTIMDFQKSFRMNTEVLSMRDCMYLARMSFFWREMVQKRKQYLFISNLTSWRTVT